MKITLAELDFDVDGLLKTTREVKNEIDELAQAQRDLRKSGESSSEEFIKNEAALKNLRREYRQNIKVISELEQGDKELLTAEERLNMEMDEGVKTRREATEQNRRLRTIQDNLNLTTEEGIRVNKQLNERIDQLINSLSALAGA